MRTVTEPVIPPVCTALAGHAAIDESTPDTKRIQDALDHCGPGKAVQLKSGAFVSGPVELRAGVTLLVDRGAVPMARAIRGITTSRLEVAAS